MEKMIPDSELGIIKLRTHPRAIRYSLKVVNGEIVGTMPVNGNEDFMLRLIRENKERLLQHLQNRPLVLLDENTQLQTHSFHLRILRHKHKKFVMALKDGYLNIACPEDILFENKETQKVLHKMLETALRHEAKRLLPPRIKLLAERHKFSYKSLKIQNSKSRWGSCSSGKNINLSLSLMLLPEHLIDYVLLHELCHTVEMNHNERFWNIMNRVTENKALSLRKELKNFHPL